MFCDSSGRSPLRLAVRLCVRSLPYRAIRARNAPASARKTARARTRADAPTRAGVGVGACIRCGTHSTRRDARHRKGARITPRLLQLDDRCEMSGEQPSAIDPVHVPRKGRHDLVVILDLAKTGTLRRD